MRIFRSGRRSLPSVNKTPLPHVLVEIHENDQPSFEAVYRLHFNADSRFVLANTANRADCDEISGKTGNVKWNQELLVVAGESKADGKTLAARITPTPSKSQ